MAIGGFFIIVAIFTTLLLNTCKALSEKSLKTTITQQDATLIGGRSKATLVPLKGHNYQSAIFFYLLTPRPNGSSFARVHRIVKIDVLPAHDDCSIANVRKQAIVYHMNECSRRLENENMSK
ncbi:unnamed protein product [Schistosoma intercalatum]|nr:unnamed protein product [Schistosoma intercalatum]